MTWKDRLAPTISSKYVKPKVGMRVKVIGNIDCSNKYVELMATIIRIGDRTKRVGLEFDENIGGNSCGGVCIRGYGRWTDDSDWNNGHLKIIKR